MIPISDDNPARLRPVVTWTVIAACILVFILQLTFSEAEEERVIETFGFIPISLSGQTGPEQFAPPLVWLTIFSSMFLHGGFIHLGGNMLYLWIFGNNVEDALGHVRYAAFYLVCGIGAALLQAVTDSSSDIPMVGASGAISGVLASYALIFPRARVNVVIPLGILFYPLKISAMYVIGFWFVLQLLGLIGPMEEGGGGTAFWAHVGGFIAGGALTPFVSRFPLFGRRPPGPWG